jgi:YD repeat-containing protein
MRRRFFLASTSLAAMSCAMMASAQSSTESYTYDALGRLVRVVTDGGQNNGETQAICYDSAGNRTVYASNTSAGATGCGTPSPTPSPTPTPTPSPTASFAISDAQGIEGTNLVFTVTRTGGAGASHSVAFATAPGTAATNDYVGTSGTLTFGPSQTTATVSVQARVDTRLESNEIFYVNLSNPAPGTTISDGQGAGTIFNDDSICTTC